MYQCFKYTNILVFSSSCLSCVRSEELHSRWLSFVFPLFDFTPSLCSSTCLCLSPCLLSVSSCWCLFTHCSTRYQLWNGNFPPLQIVNETRRRRGHRAHWWLHFLFPSLCLLNKYLFVCLCLGLFLSSYFYHCLSSCLFFSSTLSLLCPLLCLSLSLYCSQLY